MVFQDSPCHQVMHHLVEESASSMLDKYRHSLLPPEMSRKPHAVTRCSVRFLPTCRMAGQSKFRTSSNRTRHGRMRLGSSATASWGIRVIVPESLQAKVLRSLHQNHPGITRMKAIARSYFWWSGLDKAVEALAKSCSSCQVLQAAPAAAPLHPWIWPDAPWKRIHVDFAGPFLGKNVFHCSGRTLKVARSHRNVLYHDSTYYQITPINLLSFWIA